MVRDFSFLHASTFVNIEEEHVLDRVLTQAVFTAEGQH